MSGQRSLTPRFRSPAVRFVGTLGSPPLRLLFLHQDQATVERCVRELKSVQVSVVGDVVRTPEQLAGGQTGPRFFRMLQEAEAHT